MKLLSFYILLIISGTFCFTSCSDPCENVTCPEDRTCVDGECECPRGFFGEDCSKENLCITQNVQCGNNGVCINGECNCINGYSGTNCENVKAKIVWEKHYGGSRFDFFQDFTLTKDGGSIVVGISDSKDGDVSENNGLWDVWILKLNENGDIMWEKSFGGSNNESGSSIQQTTDGGYIVAGYTASNDGDVKQNKGANDVWILKLDSSGILQWEHTYGGTNSDFVSEIKQTIDGGYIVACNSSSNDGDVEKNNGEDDYWILKLNRSGNKEWAKSYGGENVDYTSSIEQTMDGGYIVAGSSRSSNGDVKANNGNFDYWIIKLNRSGDILWQGNYGGPFNDLANSILQSEDGGYIVAGYVEDVNAIKTNAFIVKLDRNGNLEWEKSYGSEDNISVSSFQLTNNEGYIIGGGTIIIDESGQQRSFSLIMKLDKFGTLDWKTVLDSSDNDYIYTIKQTNEGSYLAAGYTFIDYSEFNYYVVKLNID